MAARQSVEKGTGVTKADYRWRLGLALAVAASLLLSGCSRYLESEGIYGELPPRDESETGARPTPPEIGDSADPAVSAAGPPPSDAESRYQIYRGKGGVLGRPRRTEALVAEEPGGDITLSFVDANIREVLAATLDGVLGVNYVIAPEVKGMITMQTGRPITRASLLPTLESVLRLYGIAIVREGNLYRIGPLKGAARGNTALRLGLARADPGDGYGIQIVPLYYVGAGQMAETLRPLGREGSVLHVDQTRNVLMLGGTRRELAALLEAVEIFDVNWLAGMSFGLFKLEYAEAGALADELRALLGDDKRELLSGLVRLVPVQRLNAILAVSRQPRYLDEVRRWVERLDQSGGEGIDRQLYIYFVQNGKATNLAGVLNSVFGPDAGTGSLAGKIPPGALAPGLEPVEIQTPAPKESGGEGEQIATATSETVTGAPKALTAPSPAAPSPAAPSPAAPQPGDRAISLSSAGGVRVVADEERNALLISGMPREIRAVLSALKRLDRRPLEVLIEVTIADVTLTDRLEYGVRWFLQTGNHSITQTDSELGAVASTFPGLSYVFDVTNVKTVLDLLSSITDVKVISAPQILVLDNHEAELQVGEQVPVATQQSTSTDALGDPVIVSSITLMDTGVILKVTPRVNDGGLVIMEIEQEVSQANLDAGAGPLTPTIAKRIITTTVAVQSGQTVALGGLIQDNKTNTKVGVPILSSIPILGALFRYTTDTITRSELLVMVTPRVIRDEQGAREATDELRRRMEALEQLERKVE